MHDLCEIEVTDELKIDYRRGVFGCHCYAAELTYIQ
jgi:hypothetical protein